MQKSQKLNGVNAIEILTELDCDPSPKVIVKLKEFLVLITA